VRRFSLGRFGVAVCNSPACQKRSRGARFERPAAIEGLSRTGPLLPRELERKLELLDRVIHVLKSSLPVAFEIVLRFLQLGARLPQLVQGVTDMRMILVFLVNVRVNLART